MFRYKTKPSNFKHNFPLRDLP